MKTASLPVPFVLLLAGLASAQPPGGPPQGGPMVTNIPGSQYPQMMPDRSVVLRVSADHATKVQAEIELPTPLLLDMRKDTDDYWTVTTPPLPAGFFYYSVIVDGFAANDPGSKVFFGRGRQTSAIEITSSNVEYYDLNAIPHGTLRELLYFSQSASAWRHIVVYTPPGYDQTSTTRFPVLYLQHGGGEDETAWSRQGRESYILDSLIDSGSTKPMIVVNESGVVRVGKDTAPDTGLAFDEVVSKELIPFIDKKLRTLPGREGRALAGCGTGADQALSIALNHLDQFAWIGAFSPGFSEVDPTADYGGRMADSIAFNSSVHLLYIAMASDNPLYQGVEASHENLERGRIQHLFVTNKGPTGWALARSQLAEFVPRLFQGVDMKAAR